jgi:hypothetical protein
MGEKVPEGRLSGDPGVPYASKCRRGRSPNRPYRAPSKWWRAAAVWLLAGLITGTRAEDLNLLWQIAPGDRSYVGTANNERGLAFNAATTNLLLVSRSAGSSILVLDAATGAELRTLNVDGVSGGTFTLNMMGVSDNGVVYAANLSTAATPNFKLYRWANDQADTVPTIAFEGDPAGTNLDTGASNGTERWGDSLDVRGSGTNTMIVAAGRNTAAVAIFTTIDGTNFTSKVISGAGSAAGSLGIAFGEGNTLWTKVSGQPLRYVSYNLATGQATLLKEFAEPIVPNAVTAIGVNAAKKWLGGISIATPDTFRLYDVSSPTTVLTSVDQENIPTDNANGNGVGSVDFGAVRGTNVVFVLDTNNGIIAYRIVAPAGIPPSIATPPASQIALESGTVSFTVTAAGTTPFRYQWQFNDANLAGATNSVLVVSNAQASAAGNYRVVVDNPVGSITSSNAVLTVNALVRSDVLTPLWKIAPGDRAYVSNDNNQRGVAYNPATGNVLLVSRTGGNRIYVLDGRTGAELRQLNVDTTVISGGTFVVNMIGVSDDGVVYAASLTTDSAATGLSVYRWENDSTNAVPTRAYRGDPSAGDADATNRRFGDSFDVRGAGANTQILLASRAGKIVSILTTTDGFDFTPTVITTDAAAGDLGISVAFGRGNSFWGTAPARPLRLIDFDLTAGTGTTRQSIGNADVPTAVTSLAVNAAADLLAGITLETPDTVRLYNLASLPNPPTLVDQEVFPADNTNGNGTGSADFGGGRLYALDTNNGLVAFNVNTNATSAPKGAMLSSAARSANGAFSFTLGGTPGSTYLIEATVDFKAWSAVSTNTIAAGGTVPVTDAGASTQSRRFYRAVLKP